jgi:hypothetical protein
VTANDALNAALADKALNAALAAEYAAIFGYGVLGPHLNSSDVGAARDAEEAHRDRRDALLVKLTAAKASPPEADAAYALPYPVSDRASALKLAAALEDGAARAWHGAVGATTGNDRGMAVNALVDCATRGTHWRLIAGVKPAAQTFPGAQA